jgi:hypothetical protein
MRTSVQDGEREKLRFEKREFKGSRFRCLLVTHKPKSQVVEFLNSLVHPFATVDADDRFMPEGFCKPEEASLGQTPGFLNDNQRRTVTEWWLKVPERANTPNWDLVSTCTMDGREGLLLIEAKAHVGELKANDACGATNDDNRQTIRNEIAKVSTALGSGWRLSAESHYQLSSRFAWAWKVASLGVPVVLVYLGFLNADEMNRPFADHQAWERCLLAYAESTVPRDVWNSSRISIDGTPDSVDSLRRRVNIGRTEVVRKQSMMPSVCCTSA